MKRYNFRHIQTPKPTETAMMAANAHQSAEVIGTSGECATGPLDDPAAYPIASHIRFMLIPLQKTFLIERPARHFNRYRCKPKHAENNVSDNR
jgi:hypothetical protein